ncbi:MAG: DUF1846 domain-containing protein [Patescibacteria group bacterium]
MNSTEIIEHKELGFDNQKYLTLQQEALTKRLEKFKGGTLYLEIGGKFLYDPHAQRVLPGFNPSVKPEIVKNINTPYELLFCVNAEDIQNNRMLNNHNEAYLDAIWRIMKEYQETFPVKFSVAINMVRDVTSELSSFATKLRDSQVQVAYRYIIDGYPDPKAAVGPLGYEKDEFIETKAPLVLVIGPASNSGKLSTCLGQLYHDIKQGKNSGYAKYELFPIWNLPLKHPVNLAYEAATADIGDFNLYDYHHENAYRIDAVNYNRDVEAFPIITGLLKEFIPKDNYMQNYRSPTDMGMNNAGYAIYNDAVVAAAATAEISRRKEWFLQQYEENRGKLAWVERCEALEKEAASYRTLSPQ